MSIANEQLYRILGRFETGPHDDPDCRLTAEGAALDAYLCSADKPTIAFGCCYHPDGTPVQMGDSITEDQVYPYTEAAVARVVADVKRLVTRPLNDYQMAALCSFVFNLGGGNLASSTRLLPAINAGRWEDAAEAMGEFIRAWGKLRHTDGSMRWHRKAELGLLIRRYAEACLLLGLDWEKWCTTRKIVLHENLLWQPDWVDPKGVRKGGRYFDEVLPTTTQFHVIEEMARATPLPPLIREELILTQPASPPKADEVAQRQASPAQSPAAGAAPAIEKPASSGSVPATPPVKIPAPQRAPEGTVVLPSQVPKPPRLPDPNIPIGQQTSAVDAARKSEEWSSGTKAMWQSRRFYGLVLIMAGRLWMLKTGSNAFLGAVSDPLVMEFIGGFGVMIAGELIQSWGRAKAKRALH
jgi:GH24 family phage-related lysozyme (muramidase)